MKKKQATHKLGITTIARSAIYLMGFAIVSIQTIFLPELAREEAAGKVNPPVTYPFFVGAWILSLPVFIALYQILKLTQYIDEQTAFSEQSVTALQTIKYCAIAFSILVVLAAITTVVSVRITAPTEDTPPILLLGTILAGTSSVIATFVAVLQRLLHDAIDMKSENDLIV